MGRNWTRHRSEGRAPQGQLTKGQGDRNEQGAGHHRSSENAHWFELLNSEFTLCYISLFLLWEIMKNRVCGQMLISVKLSISFQQLLCSKINKGVYSGNREIIWTPKWQEHCYPQVPLFLPTAMSSWYKISAAPRPTHSAVSHAHTHIH